MGRVLALVLMVLLVMGNGPAHAATDWRDAAVTVALSTVSMQNVVTGEDGIQRYETVCTAFSIDEARGLFLTAFHCLGEVQNYRLDWQMAWVVYQNPSLDLAVLQTMGVKRTALKPRTAPIAAGLPIAMFGHAFGFEVPTLRPAWVSHPYMLIVPIKAQFPTLDGRFMVVSIPPIGGMSGGPIVDTEGRVVAITQMGNIYMGLGQPIEVILEATGPFWAGR
jgi:S1-C subfamily serine protease